MEFISDIGFLRGGDGFFMRNFISLVLGDGVFFWASWWEV